MTAQQSRKTVTARPVPGALAEGTAAFPYSMPVPGPRGDLGTRISSTPVSRATVRYISISAYPGRPGRRL